MDIRHKVRQLAKDMIGCDIPDDLPRGLAGFDSIDEIELIMYLEDFYEIEIKDSEAEKLSTINDIVKYLEARLRS